MLYNTVSPLSVEEYKITACFFHHEMTYDLTFSDKIYNCAESEYRKHRFNSVLAHSIQSFSMNMSYPYPFIVLSLTYCISIIKYENQLLWLLCIQ